MISSILLAAAATTVPATPEWNPTVGIIISVSCLVALLLTSFTKSPKVGPKLPVLPVTLPGFIAAMCFGHIVGIGIVLGLTNLGGI
ncbi:MAG: photosystem I reaction center subunit PsaK [Brasilonema octagenarum HA4186-MV1]|uniref:Photosystem I reaction center subunit PsaK n=2 Tax=Brasilonema TaxID=383614 RepID=A0A856MGH5_9CYAN|nr:MULTISPECIES: photosystem I reaction center subunit PsaK [Brasilonema]MBW4627995.1 photosystem I reaction center subunit PsaK [Brasilonema octagenarum HA4186-MV1]NMF62168.1 photosystem I reaction center subunit PsaK [Brasilonema octagenarum UFV-OR1]QDL08781.1 photosystem I reaction center subunit PsaK [Brasilonema sennae CENA114]QDL15139.1 photosystem I reaction center subunit PsaK [Brasilonema octagenarum UFV-E1]